MGARPLYAVADESAYHIIPGAQFAAGDAAYLAPTSQAAATAVYHSANTVQLDAALYDNPLAESTHASYYGCCTTAWLWPTVAQVALRMMPTPPSPTQYR